MRTVALALAAALFLPSVAVAGEPAPPADRFSACDRLDALGEALAGGMEATGRATFPAADGNVGVVVSDLAPDGTATRVRQGWLKASHRFGHELTVTTLR